MRRPLLEASSGLCGGLLVATAIADQGLRVGLVLISIATALAAPGPLRRLRIAILGFALGVLHAADAGGALPRDHIATHLGDRSVLVTVRGRLASEVHPLRSGKRAFDLEIESLGTSVRRTVRGTLRVLMPPGSPLAPGDRIEAIGTARPGRTPTNPGEPDRGASRRRRGRTHLLIVERPGNIRVLRTARRLSPRRILAEIRQAAARRLTEALAPPDDGLAAALLLGRRGDVPVEVEDGFRGSGTAHLLAVSGLHVGLVAGGLLLVLGRFRTSNPIRLSIVLAAVLLYAGLAGFRAPVLRAAIVSALVAGGLLLRRRTAPLDLLGAAAFLLLLADPAQAERVEFQLTFVAVLGLVLLSRRVGEAIFPYRDVERRFSAWHRAPIWRRVPRDALHRMLPAAGAAWLATAPLVLLHFGTLTPASIPANLLLVPLLVVALATAVLALALGPAFPQILSLPLVILRNGAALIASLPGASLGCARPSLLAVLIAYAALLALVARRRWLRIHLLAATAVPFGLLLLVWPRTAPAVDTLTVLDVGQGSAVLLERADGAVMLYDAGSMTPEVGRRRIAPILRAKRIRRLDVLVLSHADSDHVSAVPFLMRRFRIARLVVPETFSHEDAGRRILRLARRRGIPIRTAVAGDDVRPFGRVLHPPRGAVLSDNDGSLVLRVRLGARTALLTGDLEAPGCAILGTSGHSLEAEALLLPHHGGRNPGLPALLRRVDPIALLISAGASFPTEPIDTRGRRWRTSAVGAITVKAGPEGLRVSGFRTPPRADGKASQVLDR